MRLLKYLKCNDIFKSLSLIQRTFKNIAGKGEIVNMIQTMMIKTNKTFHLKAYDSEHFKCILTHLQQKTFKNIVAKG